MTLTVNQQVRLRIQDQPLVFDATYYGDGYLSVFPLPYSNVTSASAFVQGVNVWTPTGATFSPGSVAFSGVISANSAWRARGMYSTFSDDEIDTWITAGGSVNGAALEAVTTLMFDGLKRASWAAPDGTQYDDTRAMDLLNDLYDKLNCEQAEQAVVNGGIAPWGLQQENW